DRRLERALALRPLDVDVDPLVVAREIRELVDHVLRHFDGLAPPAELVADLRLEACDVVEANVFHGSILLHAALSGLSGTSSPRSWPAQGLVAPAPSASRCARASRASSGLRLRSAMASARLASSRASSLAPRARKASTSVRRGPR